MRVTTKGQVTIPVALREQFGLLPNTEVEFHVSEHGVVVRKARRGKPRGARVVAHLKGRGTVPLTTDEILALTRD